MKAFILRYTMYQKEWGKKCPDFFSKEYKIHSLVQRGKFGGILSIGEEFSSRHRRVAKVVNCFLTRMVLPLLCGLRGRNENLPKIDYRRCE